MTLLFSEKGDYSTNQVIDWLAYSKVNFKRINTQDVFNYSSSVSINEKTTTIPFIEKFKSLWFRKGVINFHFKSISKSIQSPELKTQVEHDIENEEGSLKHFIYYSALKNKKCLGNPFTYEVAKLYALEEAKQVGLAIPATLVTSFKSELIEFKKEQGEVILKGIQKLIAVKFNNTHYWNLTEKITYEFIEQIPDEFFPSLFQKQLDKKYELRVVFLAGECYASAIMSQTDERTKIDFRNYNYEKNNRNVVFNLPKEIKEKINALMNRIGLNFGVLDIVVNRKMEYVFLEINPVGQYDAVSKSCNYFIDKKIAEFLITS